LAAKLPVHLGSGLFGAAMTAMANVTRKAERVKRCRVDDPGRRFPHNHTISGESPGHPPWTAVVGAARGRGAVVNISSGAAATPGFGTGIYGASKAALESLTRVWAAEFGSAGVRVNAVAAGPTRTEGTAAFGAAFQAAAKSVALQRLAEAEEIAGAVAFLASDAASYVNGTVLDAIGGLPAVG
jgi:NAD(P)-dependent dehydrogenase (short-subunit alcohol dehydrogenase family)